MLQNRVDPAGNIIKTKARGAFMGNRGRLHNDQKEIVRPFKLLNWLTCVLDFNGRKREVMAHNRYTELFFMDEVTSFAAGHRPCFECRRNDYNRFKSFWLKGNPEYGLDEKTSIQKIDAVLHKERMGANNSKITFEEKVANLTNGVFILYNEKPFLFWDKKLFLWTPFGYEKGILLPHQNTLAVLTPKSVMNTFKAGYILQVAVLPLSE